MINYLKYFMVVSLQPNKCLKISLLEFFNFLDYKKIQKLQDLSEKFKTWHRSYNHYDYLLYEEFCK